MKYLMLFGLLISACGETQNTQDLMKPAVDMVADSTHNSDLSIDSIDKDSDVGITKIDLGIDAETSEDTSPDLAQNDSCTHTTQGGVYANQACSESYQCCAGVWKERATGCGTCLCIETTGAIGCNEKVEPDAYPHVGLTLEGSEIPRDGLQNNTGNVGVEKFGTVVNVDGRDWVRGTVSHFGGPNDTGVTRTETGAITGENLRGLNDPIDPSPEFLANNAGSYYFIAMRWSYSPGNRSFWKGARIILRNNANGKTVVVRPVDWGPHIRTRRTLDISPQAIDDLGAQTDDDIDVAFAPPTTPLGPYVE